MGLSMPTDSLTKAVNEKFDQLDAYIEKKKEEARKASAEEAARIQKEVKEEINKKAQEVKDDSEKTESDANSVSEPLQTAVDTIEKAKSIFSGLSPDDIAKLGEKLLGIFESIVRMINSLLLAPTIIATDAANAAVTAGTRLASTTANAATGWVSAEGAMDDLSTSSNIPANTVQENA